MAQATSKPLNEKAIGLSTAALVELSLRNHLCFSALRTEHGTAFHLGTIVRTMFASYFLFDAGFGVGDVSMFTEVDLKLGETVLSARPELPWSLTATAIAPVEALLRLYDSQLQTAPVRDLLIAHRRAEQNLQVPAQEQLSIAALVQRSTRATRFSTPHSPLRTWQNVHR
ncbi:hypothetical protein [Caballeronia hypogeia]|uniref:hypothetical protein n=1 Tax=Caballeronia hypogeia TaxID=1777140 RepID=UPI000772A2A7|nr:hypothetical protein [Caballeronia hypogeia]